MIDLGNWISGTYRIIKNNAAEDEDGETPSGEDSDKE
jgi:endogenous inhibitor of DNA gyrase (YacG/DUF329 family)